MSTEINIDIFHLKNVNLNEIITKMSFAELQDLQGNCLPVVCKYIDWIWC